MEHRCAAEDASFRGGFRRMLYDRGLTMSLSIRSTSSSSPRRGQRPRAPRRSSLAVVECLLENRCQDPRRRREIFRSSADGARVEEQGEDVAGEWVDVGGKALLGPENSRLMREAEEKERKTKVSEVAKRVERRKKSNGEPEYPQSATFNKEGRVNNALSARRKPPRLVWSEKRERKRTLGSPIFDIMP